jgi:hypothetical protein
MHVDAAQNDSAANTNTNTTALRTIIDFPLYNMFDMGDILLLE